MSNKTSLYLIIIFIILVGIFHTIPKLIFVSTMDTNIEENYKKTIYIPTIDSFEINEKIKLLLSEYKIVNQELNFRREYLNGIAVNKFDLKLEATKEEIFEVISEITLLQDITIKGIIIQKKTENIYSAKLEFSFIGVDL